MNVKRKVDVLVVGGGAAGFFAAIAAAEHGATVVLLEKTGKLLSKVAISGGGRCNVTHDCKYPSALTKHYPRGGKALKKAFDAFGQPETLNWFASRGVPLKIESDGRMFPVSNRSETVVKCLMDAAEASGVSIHLGESLKRIEPRVQEGRPVSGFYAYTEAGHRYDCSRVIVTTGGNNKPEAYGFIRELGIRLLPPVPSLFTFNVPEGGFGELQGITVPHGEVLIPGTKWRQPGPVLITHWGFSAPAVIKLSAWAAIDLNIRQYRFPILINWTGLPENEVRDTILDFGVGHPQKQISGSALFDIPSRLWIKLCELSGIDQELRHAGLAVKLRNRLVEHLVRCPFHVQGKTTFKEEFVTCGGVSLDEVVMPQFESKRYAGLYFAGEVLNVDGVTGGFNFQHAWTSGYLAGKAAAELRVQA